MHLVFVCGSDVWAGAWAYGGGMWFWQRLPCAGTRAWPVPGLADRQGQQCPRHAFPPPLHPHVFELCVGVCMFLFLDQLRHQCILCLCVRVCVRRVGVSMGIDGMLFWSRLPCACDFSFPWLRRFALANVPLVTHRCSGVQHVEFMCL